MQARPQLGILPQDLRWPLHLANHHRHKPRGRQVTDSQQIKPSRGAEYRPTKRFNLLTIRRISATATSKSEISGEPTYKLQIIIQYKHLKGTGTIQSDRYQMTYTQMLICNITSCRQYIFTYRYCISANIYVKLPKLYT